MYIYIYIIYMPIYIYMPIAYCPISNSRQWGEARAFHGVPFSPEAFSAFESALGQLVPASAECAEEFHFHQIPHPCVVKPIGTRQ